MSIMLLLTSPSTRISDDLFNLCIVVIVFFFALNIVVIVINVHSHDDLLLLPLKSITVILGYK